MASVSLNLNIWEKSYSIANNTSEIGWSLSVTSNNAYNGYDSQCPYVVRHNNSSGSIVASGHKGFNNNTTTTLASGTISNYAHNAEGKASITLYAHYTTGVSPATATITKTIQLTTIPRASSISVSNYNLGQNLSIIIGKKNNSFTSTLSYSIGSRTGTIVSKTSNSTYVWTMPDELIEQIKIDNPSTKNVIAKISCETYSGNTKIGSTQTATFNLSIIDKPVITNVTINETIELISNYTTKIVKYLSASMFDIETTASIGTTIKTYVVKCGDVERTSSSNDVVMNNIQYSYLVDEVRKTKFIITAIDARGNSSEEYILEHDFIEYVNLAFNNTDIKFTRLNDVSNFIKLHMSGYVYNGLIGESNNTLSLKYQYKEKNNTEWSDFITITPILNDNNTFSINDIQLETEFDYKKNYDIRFLANDSFLSIQYEDVIKTSETIAKWHKNGLDIKSLTIEKNPVIEHEENEKGNYIKFYDGTLICYGNISFTTPETLEAWGALYGYDYFENINFPHKFVGKNPIVHVINIGTNAYMIDRVQNDLEKINYLSIARARNNGSTVYLTYIAIGIWKEREVEDV